MSSPSFPTSSICGDHSHLSSVTESFQPQAQGLLEAAHLCCSRRAGAGQPRSVSVDLSWVGPGDHQQGGWGRGAEQWRAAGCLSLPAISPQSSPAAPQP